jgi:hypothetical protein
VNKIGRKREIETYEQIVPGSEEKVCDAQIHSPRAVAGSIV